MANTLPETPHSPNRINLLRDFVEALGQAGDALAKLTDGFKHLVVTGYQGYRFVAAERERSRLIDLCYQYENLYSAINLQPCEQIYFYIEQENPTREDWLKVIRTVKATLEIVLELIEDVKKERGDFVSEKANFELRETLYKRTSVLQQLTRMEQPREESELKLLREAHDKYLVIMENSNRARVELDKYIKMIRKDR